MDTCAHTRPQKPVSYVPVFLIYRTDYYLQQTLPEREIIRSELPRHPTSIADRPCRHLLVH